MHWLERWRLEHLMSREDLASKIENCSETLLAILEEQHGGVTHPRIAARICDYTGATPKQWDSIVPRRFRGKYVPKKTMRLPDMETLLPEPEKPKEPYKPKSINIRIHNRCKEVLQIGLDGEVMKRYKSVREAADALEKTVAFITDRIYGRLICNEFQPMGFTFRYASEWNSKARERLMNAAREASQQRENGITGTKGIFLVIDGESHCITDWAKIVGLHPKTIYTRLRSGKSAKDAVFMPGRPRKQKCKNKETKSREHI